MNLATLGFTMLIVLGTTPMVRASIEFTIVMKTHPMRLIPTLRREASALHPDAVFTSNLLADAAPPSSLRSGRKYG